MSKRQTKEWAKSCMWPVLYVFELKKFFHFKVVFKKKNGRREFKRNYTWPTELEIFTA